MTKSVIVKTWVGGVAAVAAGLLMAGVATAFMLAYGGRFIPATTDQGYEFTPTLNGFFWTMVALICVGGLVALGGQLTQTIAWIGALVNTHHLADKTWFTLLLVGGLLSLVVALTGAAAMIAYIVAGPDGEAMELSPRTAPLRRPREETLLPA